MNRREMFKIAYGPQSQPKESVNYPVQAAAVNTLHLDSDDSVWHNKLSEALDELYDNGIQTEHEIVDDVLESYECDIAFEAERDDQW